MYNQKMDNVIINLKSLIKSEKGMRQYELCKILDVAESTVGHYMTGRRKLGYDQIITLASYFNVSVDELVSKRGSGLLNMPLTSRRGKSKYPLQDALTRDANIPFFKTVELSAGGGSIIPDFEGASKNLSFKTEWIKSNNWKESDLVIVNIRGDSMLPRIQDGDIALVNTSIKNIVENKIYAINYNGEAKLKRLSTQIQGNIVISSDNPNPIYKDEIIPPEQQNCLFIIGRAVWIAGKI